MNDPQKGYELISSCKHDTNCEIEGYLVCMKCGKVLETSTFEENICKLSLDGCEKYISDNLLDMVDLDLISKDVYFRATDLKVEWAKENRSKKSFHNIFAVYQASRELKYPITLHEICQYFQISVKKISEMEKYFQFHQTNTTEVYVNKFSGMFELTESEKNELINECIKWENIIDSRPITIVAAVFFLKLKRKKSMKYISDVFVVSTRTIDRVSSIILENS